MYFIFISHVQTSVHLKFFKCRANVYSISHLFYFIACYSADVRTGLNSNPITLNPSSYQGEGTDVRDDKGANVRGRGNVRSLHPSTH